MVSHAHAARCWIVIGLEVQLEMSGWRANGARVLSISRLGLGHAKKKKSRKRKESVALPITWI